MTLQDQINALLSGLTPEQQRQVSTYSGTTATPTPIDRLAPQGQTTPLAQTTTIYPQAAATTNRQPNSPAATTPALPRNTPPTTPSAPRPGPPTGLDQRPERPEPGKTTWTDPTNGTIYYWDGTKWSTYTTHDPNWTAPTAPGTSGGSDSGSAGGFANLSPQQAWEKAVHDLGYAGGTPQSQETLKKIADYLAAHGYPGFSATGADTIAYNGQGYDVLTSGNQWWWNPDNAAGSEFTDPWGSTLEDFVRKALGQQSADYSAYLKELEASKAAQRAAGANIAKDYQTRASELRQYPYTSGDEATIQAKAFDALERRRQQTLQNETERVYERGFAPTSGLVEGARQEVNRNFEQQRTGIQSDLTLSAIQEEQRRRDAATQLDALAQQALAGGDLTAIQMLAQQAGLTTQDFNNQNTLTNQMLQLIAAPLSLEQQRQQTALQTLSVNGSQDPLNAILQLLQSAFTGAGQQQNMNNNNYSGLGAIIQMLLQAYSG